MPDYATSPAPSPKTLWYAEKETDWATHYANHLHKSFLHSTLRICDLVEFKNAVGTEHNQWYTYADSFSLLTILAANIVMNN